MFNLLKHFLKGDRGEAVTWIVLVIIGVILAVAAFLKFKSSPGNVGNEISGAASNAAQGLNAVKIQ